MDTEMRVGAIILQGKQVLTTKMESNDNTYHVLPGGRVEGDETIEEALERELMEETGLELTGFRLAYIRELDLKENSRGLEFYFLVEEYSGTPETGHDPEDKDAELKEVCKTDLEDLEDVEFHPEQLVKELRKDRKTGFEEVQHLGLHKYP